MSFSSSSADTTITKSLLEASFNSLTFEEKKSWYQHSAMGETLLIPLDQYHYISHFIRHHHERYDGKGFPDKLAGEEIPLGAVILAVAEDFDEACSGLLFDDAMSINEARQMIANGSGQSYRPDVVCAFLTMLQNKTTIDTASAMNKVSTSQLVSGMVLEKDLIKSDGALLLKAATVLADSHIRKIRQIENEHQAKLVLWIANV